MPSRKVRTADLGGELYGWLLVAQSRIRAANCKESVVDPFQTLATKPFGLLASPLSAADALHPARACVRNSLECRHWPQYAHGRQAKWGMSADRYD